MGRAAFVAVLCAFVATPALAGPSLYGTVDVQYTGLIRGVVLDLVSSQTIASEIDTLEAGLFQLQFSNPSFIGPDAIPDGSYFNPGSTSAFCIDLADSLPYVSKEYDVVSLDAAPDPWAVPTLGGMGADKARLIAELLTKNTYETPEKAAAMQVAIWEIIDENYGGGSNPWNVSGGQGNFYLDTVNGTHGEGAIAGLANTMLTTLTTGLPFDKYTAVSNGPGVKNVQDLVVVPVPVSVCVPIPLPGALLLGMFGVGAIGLMRRKFA